MSHPENWMTLAVACEDTSDGKSKRFSERLYRIIQRSSLAFCLNNANFATESWKNLIWFCVAPVGTGHNLLPSLVSAPTTPVACVFTSDGKGKRFSERLYRIIQRSSLAFCLNNT
jgi:hypothetical protein